MNVEALAVLGVGAAGFIAGFAFGWYAPPESWGGYVFQRAPLSTTVVLLAIFVLVQKGPEERGLAIGWGLLLFGPVIYVVSLVTAGLGGGLALLLRRRKKDETEKP